MSDHLPEVVRWSEYVDGMVISPTGYFVTYADHVAALRACEQRSYALGIEVGKHDGWVAGHAAGVQAARDAVAAAYDDERYAHRDNWGVPVVYKDLMLAAIDALKEKK